MKKIKIYQVNLESGYAFMSYEYAKDILEMEDYELVAEFDLDSDKDDELIAERIYLEGNDGSLVSKYEMRSISVSDIIEIDGNKYYVNSFGYQKI